MDWSFLKNLLIGIFYNQFVLCLPTYLGLISFVMLLLSPKWGGKMKLVKEARKHALSILMGFILISVILTSHSLYKNKLPNFATPDALISPVLQNMDIRISDLTRESNIVQNKTFINCRIFGSAIIHGVRLKIFNGIVETKDVNSFFVETTNKSVLGAIQFKDCIMDNCTFHRISLIGNAKTIKSWKANINK